MSGQHGQDAPGGNFTSCVLFAFSSLVSCCSCFECSGGTSERQAKWKTEPGYEDVVQVRMEVVLPVPCSPCKPRNARERILLKCYKRLGLSEAENHTFIQYLGQTANLNVKKDTEPFAGEDHSWNVDANIMRKVRPPRLPPHSSSFSCHKMHISLRTSPGPLSKIPLPLCMFLYCA